MSGLVAGNQVADSLDAPPVSPACLVPRFAVQRPRSPIPGSDCGLTNATCDTGLARGLVTSHRAVEIICLTPVSPPAAQR
ncbi:MAG TPA: hypothetical protein VN961_05565, partial [Streptosporangiaceae bacterium]|nr:hypothetical protein [Streptosporangiaceae bacterium]